MQVTEDTDLIAEVRRLYGECRYVQAYHLASQDDDLRQWRGTPRRLLAGRLASQLCADRLRTGHFFRAYRETPTHPEAICYYAQIHLDRVGPARAWEFVQQHAQLADAPAEISSHWLYCRAAVCAAMRDFESADRDLETALDRSPGKAWLWLSKAHICELEDRYDDAMACVGKAMVLTPDHPNAACARAHLLTLRNTTRQAIDELRNCPLGRESPILFAFLATLLEQQRNYTEALETWDEFESLCPLRETGRERLLAMARSRLEYLRGDVARSITLARKVGVHLFDHLANTMEANQAGRRVELPIEFVRQHHNTCAPATLTAISHFWGNPVEHLQVAQEICYDGTQAHSERSWAEHNGFVAREFTLDATTAMALLDRGIPFILNTVEATSAHLQAVAGYDSCRNTLLIRDPYQPSLLEFDIPTTLERYRSTGPRAMVMVPQEKPELLDGIALPESGIWDQLHLVQTSLHEHNRTRAAEVVRQMEQTYGLHRLVLTARRCLYSYDANSAELLAVARQFLQMYPNDASTELLMVLCLERLGRRQELLELLAEICARPAADPVFMSRLASELSRDARDLLRATTLVHRVLRQQRADSAACILQGNILWARQQFEHAMVAYRFAACLDIKNESAIQAMFVASRHLRQTDQVLAFLSKRVEAAADRSGQPATWLFRALDSLNRTQEGLDVLKQAMARRPDDGDLLLFAAEAHAQTGDLTFARELHQRAAAHCARQAWLRTAVCLARRGGESAAAIGHAREVLELDPLAMDMHDELASLLADAGGPSAAITHLRATVLRFPFNYALRRMLIQWLQLDPPATWEQETRELVKLHPADSWSRCRLAANLAQQRRFPEAREQFAVAMEIDPRDDSIRASMGDAEAAEGNVPAATECYREAIRLWPDNVYAIDQLIALCASSDQIRQTLRYIQQQLEQRVTFGDGLLAYQRQGYHILPDAELLSHLRNALKARPDLWQAWAALAQQHAAMNCLQDAAQVGKDMTERFPLVAPVWCAYARICRATDDVDGEIEALTRAWELDMSLAWAVRLLADALNRAKRRSQAIAVLEKQIARFPRNALERAQFGRLLWEEGRREQAIEQVRSAVILDPSQGASWAAFDDFARQLDQPAMCSDLARELTTRRPCDADAWGALARTLPRPARMSECLMAARKAVELNPLTVDSHDFLATLLTEAGQFDAAVEACRPAVWKPHYPLPLRGREIWVEYCRGQPEAIGSMQTLLQQEPQYLWGWRQLTEWLEAHPGELRFLEAARELCQLTPDDPVALGLLGHALVAQGHPDEAANRFAQALKLSPDYGYAARQLLRLHIQAARWDAANELIAARLQRGAASDLLLTAIHACCEAKASLAAKTYLHSLTERPDASMEVLDDAAGLCLSTFGPDHVITVLRPATRRPDVTPAVVGATINALGQSSAWIGAWYLRWRFRKRQEFHEAMDRACLNFIAQKRQHVDLTLFLFICRRRLRASTATWGSAGYALLSLNARRKVCRWLADYASRPDAQPWMLLNRVMSLAMLGRDRQAAETASFAVTLQADHTTPQHWAFLAITAALAGRPGDAQTAIAACSDLQPRTGPHMLRAIAIVLVGMQQPGQSPESLQHLSQQMGNVAAIPASEWHAPFDRLYGLACTKAQRLTGIKVAPTILMPRSKTGSGTNWWIWIAVIVGIKAIAMALERASKP